MIPGFFISDFKLIIDFLVVSEDNGFFKVNI